MESPDDLAGLPTMEIEEVQPGDLIFTARPGRLQTLVELAGDPWRHVGVATIVDGELGVSEVAGHAFQFRPLRSVATTRHTAVGVARFPRSPDNCSSGAADWVAGMLANENLYAWDDLIVAGVLLAIRRRTPPARFREVMAVVREAERLALEVPPPADRRSFTCASFAFHAFAQAGATCRPDVTIEPVRTRPARFRDEETDRPPPLAELVALAEQGDIDALAGPLGEYSLLELSGVLPEAEGARTRVSATSRMNADQFVATTRNLIRIMANVRTDELPSRLVLDERWISVGDLWRLETIEVRALLPLSPVDASAAS